YTYTPADDFNGPDSFTVEVSDGNGGSDMVVVNVTVNAVNDASELDAFQQGNSTHIEVVDAADLAPTWVSADVTLTDVDNLDYDTASFTAEVTSGDSADQLGLSSAAVSVFEGTVSVNDNAVGSVTGMGTSLVVVTFTSAAFAADVEAVVSALTYATTDDTPAASRDITLDLTDGDGLPSMQQVVTVDVIAQNDSPTPVDDDISVTEGSFSGTINVVLQAPVDTDPEDDTLTVTNVADIDDDLADAIPVGGSASVSGAAGVITTDWGAEVSLQSNGQLTYNLTSASGRFNELASGETETDTFSYTVSDGNGGETTATVSVEITGVNDNILAVADTITGTEDGAGSITGNILDNDTDVDANDSREIIGVFPSVTASAIATAGGFQITTTDDVVIQLSSDGTYTLTAPDELDGDTVYTATFQYTVQDGGSSQSSTTVTVEIAGDNDVPTASAVTLTASDEDAVRIITEAELLTGTSDVDESAMLNISDLTLTSGNGQLVDNMNGTWTYTPDLNDNSDVTFSYTVSDGTLTATASAGLDLLPVNDAPEIDEGVSDLAPAGDEDMDIT
ncbi:tandem-95 repeat protein, partial [uncultured Pelagimonas sp.]|uniref:tandem-95 repeat protein n=1 Tax=uncultured Pelagimonas sp. TaxID=1618102 RepID=UPI002611562F